MKGISGHDGLCCQFPNGKKKKNPYESLLPSVEYGKELNKMDREEML